MQKVSMLDGYKLFQRGILAFEEAERRGIRVDVSYCKKESEKLNKTVSDMELSFKRTNFYKRWEHINKGSLNIHSHTQLSHYLYNVLKLEKEEGITDSGAGEESLLQLNIPELSQLIDIRKLKKAETYLQGFIKLSINGYIHPSFNLHLARTYRSSSDNPNFQNIPKRDKRFKKIIRGALYARPGNILMGIDFKGIEVSVAACYHKDPTMLKYVRNPNSDMHGDLAAQIFKIKGFDKDIDEYKVLRNATKNGFTFPQFYGAYYKTCAPNLACDWGKLPKGKWSKKQGLSLPNEQFLSDHMISVGINSLDKFTEHIRVMERDFWDNRFPVYKRWKERWWEEYKKKGYITTLTGFVCKGVMGRNDCINYPIQGSAFHCLLWCFIRINELFKLCGMESYIIGQIHDEIIVDVVPEELDIVNEIVTDVMSNQLGAYWDWIIVPMNVEKEISDIGGSWAVMEKYKV